MMLDVDTMLKVLTDQEEQAEKFLLGQQADAYFNRMYKISAIVAHWYSVHPEFAEVLVKKFQPVTELLTEELNSLMDKYQNKHGEI